MTNVYAFSILALTIGLSLKRPIVGRLRIHHSAAALIGAALMLATGIVPLQAVPEAAWLLLFPVITIVSLMIVTLIAERVGLFEALAWRIAAAARGDGRRLFTYLFFSGTLVGTFFTNDAAVLIFTPLVFKLIEEVQGPTWRADQKTPYYFAVLYVANLVGGLVISNPINIIIASIFQIDFLEYARWMLLPALASIGLSYVGLQLFFARSLPATYEPGPARRHAGRHRLALPCAAILGLTLLGFFTEGLTHVPTWLVALLGATLLFGLYAAVEPKGVGPVICGVGWDVLIFVFGIFIVSLGLRNVGLTEQIGNLIASLAGGDLTRLTFVTGLAAAISSAIMNNHPTTYLMASVIRDLALPPLETKMLVYAALVGGDLGPKMLPIGSLAALMWFRILRDRGVQVPYALYVKIGVPVTLLAVIISIAIVNLELHLSQQLVR